MHVIDTSAHTPNWHRKYVLGWRYACYGAYAPMTAGNTGLEDMLPYFKREWIPYGRE